MAATQEHDVTPRHLDHADTLELPVTGDGPFDFLHTVWKPSHYATGLEAHTATRSWRTFRVGDLVTGVRLHAEDRLVIAEVYTDGDYKPSHRGYLARRLTASYGLDEDLSQFTELAAAVPQMREPLQVLSGMRQSCPEDHFEIAVVALLLQNVTIARTTQMTRNLLTHHGQPVRFDGITLRAWFTPAELALVSAETLKEQDRLGYGPRPSPTSPTSSVITPPRNSGQPMTWSRPSSRSRASARTPPQSRPRTRPGIPPPSAWTCGTAKSSPGGSWTPTARSPAPWTRSSACSSPTVTAAQPNSALRKTTSSVICVRRWRSSAPQGVLRRVGPLPP